MRIALLTNAALFAVISSAALAVAPNDGWNLTSGFHGGGDIGYLPNDKPSVLMTGSAATAGMTGSDAIYLKGAAGHCCGNPKASFIRFGGLERHIPLDALRGKRVLLTLRLKDEGEENSFASAQINKSSGSAIRAATQVNRRSDASWQTHQFVLDVPDNATDLVIDVGMMGQGTAWLDGFTLDAVNGDAPATRSRRIDPLSNDGCHSESESCALKTGAITAMPD